MPTYAYRCPEGHDFDLVQKISAPPGATCPECGRAAQRIITGGAGLVFKGSGFYITDYKRAEKKGPEAKEPKSKDAATGEGGGGKGSGSSSGDTAGPSTKKRESGKSDS